MLGTNASARSQRHGPGTCYVPRPVTTLFASRVSQFPPPVAALEVPPPLAGATNVPAPVTMILSPSAAVADAEPKISHPIWAAAVGAPTLAESASARDVAGAATGALFSHARAIATTPRSVASHLLHFICASLPTVSLGNASDRGLGGTAAHERDNGAPGCGVQWVRTPPLTPSSRRPPRRKLESASNSAAPRNRSTSRIGG